MKVTKCSKCEASLENGGSVYGRCAYGNMSPLPELCKDCSSHYDRYWQKHPPKDGSNAEWKRVFEEWLGMSWLDLLDMKKETKIIFT